MLEVTMTPNPLLMVTQFATFGIDIRSYREPLKRSIQKVLSPSFQKNFAEGGRPTWEPLSPETIRQRSALGYDDKTLVRTGKLAKVAGQLNIWDVKTDSAQVTSLPGAEYGGVHQAGYEPNIPQREFMIVQDEDDDAMAEVFADWITERALAAGVIGAFT